jgi:hypothetical protein
MPRTKTGSSPDPAILEAALEGLEIQRQRVEEQIRQVRSLLGKPGRTPKGGDKPSAKRDLSEAARRRISLAQKKRWAAFRKAKAAAGAK